MSDDRLEIQLRAVAGEEEATKLAAFRVIVDVVADPSADLSVAAIASRTKLTRDQVARALRDQEFQAILAEQTRFQVGGLIARTLAHVEKILGAGKVSAKDTAALLRALTGAHTALAASSPKHDAKQAESDIDALLNRLKVADVTVKRVESA